MFFFVSHVKLKQQFLFKLLKPTIFLNWRFRRCFIKGVLLSRLSKLIINLLIIGLLTRFFTFRPLEGPVIRLFIRESCPRLLMLKPKSPAMLGQHFVWSLASHHSSLELQQHQPVATFFSNMYLHIYISLVVASIHIVHCQLETASEKSGGTIRQESTFWDIYFHCTEHKNKILLPLVMENCSH